MRERFTDLRAMPGFAAAVDALGAIEGISGYLRVMGASYVPASERDRAEAAVERFLGRVWEDSTTFELEHAALRARVSRARVHRLRGHRGQHRAGARDRRRARRAIAGISARGSALVARRPRRRAARGGVGQRPRRRGAAHARDADGGVAAQRAAAADGGARRVQAAGDRPAPVEARAPPCSARRPGGAPTTGRGRPRRSGSAGRVRGARYWLDAPERPELAELFELCARAPCARRVAALGAGAVRARLRAAGRAGRPVGPPAGAAGAARPRRVARRARWRGAWARCAPSRRTAKPCRRRWSRRSGSNGW